MDGFSGPGLNEHEGTTLQGSPLIALDVARPFTKYFFCEKKKTLFTSLKEQVEQHPLKDRVVLYNADFNEVVDLILPQIHPAAPTFFFLDPEGLELKWDTVKKIGQRDKADIFILISSMGVIRADGLISSATQTHDSGMDALFHDVLDPGKQKKFGIQATEKAIDDFFGASLWRETISQVEKGLLTKSKFEALTDLYVERMKELGLQDVENRLIATNIRNSNLHSLVFLAKNEVANRIATNILSRLSKPKENSSRHDNGMNSLF